MKVKICGDLNLRIEGLAKIRENNFLKEYRAHRPLQIVWMNFARSLGNYRAKDIELYIVDVIARFIFQGVVSSNC